MDTAEKIIELYGMEPLPFEGGYYVETYRTDAKVQKANLPPGYPSARNFCSEILYLLTADTCSRLHRVRSDEIFHFYLGDSVKILNLFADGTKRVINLGPNILNDQQIQIIVPKGTWQGALIEEPGKFALMGCTVAPAFDFEDFQMADRQQILDQYPNEHELIEKLV